MKRRPVTCPCSRVFESAVPRAKYCSTQCRQDFTKQRMQQRLSERTCPCGVVFKPTHTDQVHHSKECAYALREQPRRGYSLLRSMFSGNSARAALRAAEDRQEAAAMAKMQAKLKRPSNC